MTGTLISDGGSGHAPQLTALSYQEHEPVCPRQPVRMHQETIVQPRVWKRGPDCLVISVESDPGCPRNSHWSELKNLCINITDGIWHGNIQDARPRPTHLFRPQHAQVLIASIPDEGSWVFSYRPIQIRCAPSAKVKPTKYSPG